MSNGGRTCPAELILGLRRWCRWHDLLLLLQRKFTEIYLLPKKKPRRIKYNVASLSNKKEGKEQYSSRVPLSESISFHDSKTKFKHKYIQGSQSCSRKVNSNTNITLD